MGKTEKTGKKITQLNWPKYQKPKDKNMGWTKCKIGHTNQIITVFDILNQIHKYGLHINEASKNENKPDLFYFIFILPEFEL